MLKITKYGLWWATNGVSFKAGNAALKAFFSWFLATAKKENTVPFRRAAAKVVSRLATPILASGV